MQALAESGGQVSSPSEVTMGDTAVSFSRVTPSNEEMSLAQQMQVAATGLPNLPEFDLENLKVCQ